MYVTVKWCVLFFIFCSFPGSVETLKAEGKRKADPLWLKTQQLIIQSENDSKERQSGTESRTTNFSTMYGRDLLPAKKGEENTKQFLFEVVHILLNYVSKSFDRNTKVLDFHYPHQLKDGLEGFSLELSDNPENLEQLLVDCRDTLKYGVKTGHPRFFNQLSTGLDVIGLAGEWLTATANTNIFTFEISPVFIMMEEILLKKMYEKIGWPSEEGDGIFSPGGSISNLYSVLVARYYRFPEAKTKGMASVPRLVLFTSEHSHYSIKKAAAVLGIGTENVILVKCNERGKMIPSELESKIMETLTKGFVPFYVNATAGTTVYGAIDPLSEIADICKKYKLWMHVDAAWGGGLLMSRKHSVKLSGIERASSVTWNPHKLMGAPLQCSAILVRKKGLLQLCNQLCADYLFQPDKHYDVSYDTGDKAIQCGRHVDVFKFWLMWKAKGAEGFEVQVNKCLDNAEYLYNKLKQIVDFKLVFDGKPEHSNVCFWYIPPSLRELPNGQERSKRLHEVAPRIKAKMMEEGTTMIGYQPQGENVNFFRCVFSNPATSKADVDFLIEEIVRLGNDL
ncbi:glutamate decarboxylase 1-like [Acipenser oxyrinchus oxyrinchus]|uniref:Glutamate decarboxylase 1-like n=1 Tax=Acipenser oxyrinchus oxyrinchus TaxID=40147 RepID=A0AAD8GH07_ACIOX|nr:glutamate decarboxylase 1-like [Acipenser oxyrinchus oxyrinchus]